MPDINTTFCSLLLAQTKRECRKAGIKVPRMTTIRYKSGNTVQYDVWTDRSQGFFTAYNASEAKAKYLRTLLQRKYGAPEIFFEARE